MPKSVAVVLGTALLFSSACGGQAKVRSDRQAGSSGAGNAPQGGGGTGQSGSGGSGAVDSPGGEAGSPEGGSGGSTAGTGGSAGSPTLSMGGVRLRLLTQAEYLASLQSLFGAVSTPLEPPADTSVDGFVSVGASLVHVSPTTAAQYETASLAIVREVFDDAQRWHTLVGCQPEPTLGDACVETFVRSFGRRAYRRELTEVEVTRWVGVAREAAALGGSATFGLSTLVSGFLQSLHFLYRIEANLLDPSNGRLKYDGRSMAVRLAYFLTGGPPSTELLAAGESGQLDTAEGLRAAAAPMLSDSALVGQLSAFFAEYTGAHRVTSVEKDAAQFPELDATLRRSMQESARLFFENVVLAPGADVRFFFDSNRVFADAALAALYGLPPPASGFAELTLPASSGRAGVLGQAAFLTAHSKPDSSSPTQRGLFILQALLCETPEPPPAGVGKPGDPLDPALTTREKLELVTMDPACSSCHVAFDPLGFALEHFDAIGRYRETENGSPIDARGAFADGTRFDGARELGAALRKSATATECLLRHFYRSVNGRADDGNDRAGLDDMVASLGARNYVFRDLVADFVASDAFRSAPALPVTDEK